MPSSLTRDTSDIINLRPLSKNHRCATVRSDAAVPATSSKHNAGKLEFRRYVRLRTMASATGDAGLPNRVPAYSGAGDVKLLIRVDRRPQEHGRLFSEEPPAACAQP